MTKPHTSNSEAEVYGHRVRPDDIAMLGVLARADKPLYAITVADWAGLNRRSIGAKLSRLVRRGLVRGEYHADKRINLWTTTDLGYQVARHAGEVY